MTWYSYFLMTLPETFALIMIAFVLFGLPIKRKINSILLFSAIQGVFSFTFSILMQNSLKPFLTLLSFFILVIFIFRYHPFVSLVISLTSYFFLVIFEVSFTFLFLQIFSISYEALFEMPWIRILMSNMVVQLPILILALFIHKFNWVIRLPIFEK